jgi:hypothetical protein
MAPPKRIKEKEEKESLNTYQIIISTSLKLKDGQLNHHLVTQQGEFFEIEANDMLKEWPIFGDKINIM